MKASVKEQLRETAKLYAKTAAKQGSEPIPPGTGYQGIIGSCTIGMSKNEKNPRLQVTWPITITEPKEHEGKEHYDFSGLQSENNIAYFKGRLEKIDVAVPDDIADIADALDECEGLEVLFDVVKNDEFTNTYFRSRVADAKDSKKSGKADKKEESAEYNKKELKALGKNADDEDDSAIEELEEAAKANDLDPDDYDTWLELAEAIIEELEL